MRVRLRLADYVCNGVDGRRVFVHEALSCAVHDIMRRVHITARLASVPRAVKERVRAIVRGGGVLEVEVGLGLGWDLSRVFEPLSLSR